MCCVLCVECGLRGVGCSKVRMMREAEFGMRVPTLYSFRTIKEKKNLRYISAYNCRQSIRRVKR